MNRLSALRPAVGIAALACCPVEAMMPASAYDDALAAADVHLQLAVTSREMVPVTKGHGLCAMAGVVVDVFRGSVQVGEEITVAVPCRHEQAEVPIGGTIFTPVAELAAATFVELVLEHDANGHYRAAAEGKGVVIIDEPSPEPVIEMLG